MLGTHGYYRFNVQTLQSILKIVMSLQTVPRINELILGLLTWYLHKCIHVKPQYNNKKLNHPSKQN